jgi:hypothetical protein
VKDGVSWEGQNKSLVCSKKSQNTSATAAGTHMSRSTDCQRENMQLKRKVGPGHTGSYEEVSQKAAMPGNNQKLKGRRRKGERQMQGLKPDQQWGPPHLLALP